MLSHSDVTLRLQQLIFDRGKSFLKIVNGVLYGFHFGLQVRQNPCVLVGLRLVASAFLDERRHLRLLGVLPEPAFAFADPIVEGGQFVLGFVQVFDGRFVLGDQFAVFAGISQVAAGLVGPLADRCDLAPTDEERRLAPRAFAASRRSLLGSRRSAWSTLVASDSSGTIASMSIFIFRRRCQ